MDVECFKCPVSWSIIYARRTLLEGQKSIEPKILVWTVASLMLPGSPSGGYEDSSSLLFALTFRLWRSHLVIMPRKHWQIRGTICLESPPTVVGQMLPLPQPTPRYSQCSSPLLFLSGLSHSEGALRLICVCRGVPGSYQVEDDCYKSPALNWSRFNGMLGTESSSAYFQALPVP